MERPNQVSRGLKSKIPEPKPDRFIPFFVELWQRSHIDAAEIEKWNDPDCFTQSEPGLKSIKDP